MRTDEIMSADPVRVPADTSLEDAARQMVTLGIHHLLVVDADGRLLGVVLDYAVFSRGGFLLDAWVVFEDDDEGRTVGDVMMAAEREVAPDTDLSQLLHSMTTGQQDCAVVVDEARRPVGIVTEHDALQVAMDLAPDALRAAHEASYPVITIGVGDSAVQALARMQERHIRHLPVVDRDGHLRGVVSLRDLLTDDVLQEPFVKTGFLLRSDEVHTGRLEESVHDVAARMLKHRIGCVPLVDAHRRPVGILTRRDVLAIATAALEADDLFEGPDGAT